MRCYGISVLTSTYSWWSICQIAIVISSLEIGLGRISPSQHTTGQVRSVAHALCPPTWHPLFAETSALHHYVVPWPLGSKWYHGVWPKFNTLWDCSGESGCVGNVGAGGSSARRLAGGCSVDGKGGVARSFASLRTPSMPCSKEGSVESVWPGMTGCRGNAFSWARNHSCTRASSGGVTLYFCMSDVRLDASERSASHDKRSSGGVVDSAS